MNFHGGNEEQRIASSLEFGDASASDIGLERAINEDRYAVFESGSGTAWFVLDGMGGVEGGEFAAQLALDAIRRYVETHEHADPAAILRGAISDANGAVVLRRQNQKFASMGTTVVAVMIDEMEVAISHIGDSRAYLVHREGITQLTIDDTLVQQMVDAGQLKPEEALSHPDAHFLTRCLGTQVELDVPLQHFWRLPSESSDVIVLCSDGLYGLVFDQEIAEAVRTLAPGIACQTLIALANSRGGYDNITVSIVPLQGALTDRAPEGWDKVRDARQRKRAKLNKPPLPVNVHVMILMSLCVVAAFATTILFAIEKSLIS